MTASPIGVDGVTEGHAGLRRDGVDHPLGPDLEELEAPELAVAGPPGGGLVVEERLLGPGGLVGEPPAQLGPCLLRRPGHGRSIIERVFVVERGQPARRSRTRADTVFPSARPATRAVTAFMAGPIAAMPEKAPSASTSFTIASSSSGERAAGR